MQMCVISCGQHLHVLQYEMQTHARDLGFLQVSKNCKNHRSLSKRTSEDLIYMWDLGLQNKSYCEYFDRYCKMKRFMISGNYGFFCHNFHFNWKKQFKSWRCDICCGDKQTCFLIIENNGLRPGHLCISAALYCAAVFSHSAASWEFITTWL